MAAIPPAWLRFEPIEIASADPMVPLRGFAQVEYGGPVARPAPKTSDSTSEEGETGVDVHRPPFLHSAHGAGV